MIQESDKSPRERRRGANEGRILDAAMRIIGEAGLEGLSMARLAEAADYTPGALYRYFPSKDALLARLVLHVLGEAQEFLTRAAGALPESAPPLARVFALAQGYRAFARQKPNSFGLLAMTMADPRVLIPGVTEAAPVTARVITTLELIASALGAAEAAGQLEPGDVAERTLCLFATLQGLLQLHKQARFAPNVLQLDELTVMGTRALLIGWGARARTVDAALVKVAALSNSLTQGLQ